ncbi:HTH-type transcriptional regulator / antitoxin HigA [Vibrio crassostreae]|uniref:ImmA/IrrE family metallo-endopeptidase n=1 Tax=Vibrio crassostreae TaxID=246167 RepID=UPI001B314100|nr:ImmA/IrrE family metallo-endopeptidase [Vibrio crassostreae]CAK1941526.1 HTH-type transcriptional regulator / antitoxin HigA [Vibrio crassostreae]CAK1947613.1 HTH-type transcriptional regulator / antitoxin HigA [Vibrio crassostreae]CAK2013699.1 HTH-type transcriptional regulator / antitoxin HigA [Vibrio crassostreae]CAK2329324.1 HTH-type transcriptional regulator / antitoxin HigA [Vibrio crassostreae]CAK2329832.1 HTH-type transcriptional regulator / antitoxin HigA [Vibrio crassostreae]
MAIRIRNKRNNSQSLPMSTKTPEDVIAIAKRNEITTNPLDLSSLCHVLGIGIQFVPLENNISGRLHHDGNRWIINVNSLHHQRRQRFTIAHELGHYFLHRNSQEKYEDATFHRGKQYSLKELEADNFAGALLMPKAEFKDFVRSYSNKIDDIAEHFGTSSVAIKKRADVIRSNSYEF